MCIRDRKKTEPQATEIGSVDAAKEIIDNNEIVVFGFFKVLICEFLRLFFYLVFTYNRALQPVATCRQSPYFHKSAIVIMTSFSLWHHSHGWCLWHSRPTTNQLFSLWCHSLLSWPCPALLTYERTYGHLPRLIYEDKFMSTCQYLSVCCA